MLRTIFSFHLCYPGGTPYHGLYGEASPGKDTFFRTRVHKRVGISIVEVYERVGKSVVLVCNNGYQMHFCQQNSSKKRSAFVSYSYFKNRAVTLVKRDVKF